MNILVTGGAGFIGSHLTDKLIAEKHTVTVLDNLHSGNKQNLNPKAKLLELNIMDPKLETTVTNYDAVFHLAAYPIVSASADAPKVSFENNVLGTLNVLEACRKNDVKQILFCSTSTVYGDTKVMPTPEDYHCLPISNYGASKLACEAYLSSYASTYGIKCTVVRYANIYGQRSNHGVMYDFYHKLKKNPNQMEILGDGKQEKSYLHISDCVSGTLTAFKKQTNQYGVYNVGSEDKHKVDEIAKYISKAMGLNPEFTYTGGARGWKGDIPVMLLDIKKLKALGWKPEVSFEQGIQKYVNWLKAN